MNTDDDVVSEGEIFRFADLCSKNCNIIQYVIFKGNVMCIFDSETIGHTVKERNFRNFRGQVTIHSVEEC